MTDIIKSLNALRRPRLLIRAARIGAAQYHRNAHLPRHLGHGRLPRSDQALVELMALESALNEQRCSENAGYSVARHVDIMIAMMGEARIFKNAYQSDPTCQADPT